MKLTNLKIRSKLVCRMTETEGHEFTVRLEQVIDDVLFYTDLPIVTGGAVRFKPGTKLDFIHTTDEGIYYFRGVVKENKMKSSDFMIVAMTSPHIMKMQRRNFFRMETSRGCFIKKFTDFFSYHDTTDDCVIENISAGGIKFFSENDVYQIGDLIYIKTDFFKGMKGLWGEVVNTEAFLLKKVQSGFFVSVRFEEMSEKETGFLVRCMYERQREMLKLTSKK